MITFPKGLAKEVGVDNAIMLEYFWFWHQRNEANKRNYHDGGYWTYNTTEAFSKFFYFWSGDQIRRILTSLKKKGYILIGNYNKVKFDRTKWYALTAHALDRMCYFHLVEFPNGVGETPRSELVESPNENWRNPQTNTINSTCTVPLGSTQSVRTRETKTSHAEFVHLTEKEYDKLTQEHGLEATLGMIEILDDYKGSNRKKYKSDYRAIRLWVVNAYHERLAKKTNAKIKPAKIFKTAYERKMDEAFRLVQKYSDEETELEQHPLLVTYENK